MSTGVGRQCSPQYSSPQGERIPTSGVSEVEVTPHPVLPGGGVDGWERTVGV